MLPNLFSKKEHLILGVTDHLICYCQRDLSGVIDIIDGDRVYLGKANGWVVLAEISYSIMLTFFFFWLWTLKKGTNTRKSQVHDCVILSKIELKIESVMLIFNLTS